MTEDSKAFPLIDDAMVKRFVGAGGCYQRGKSVDQCVREGLEAALDRRTGPKCRRVEFDDTSYLSRRKLYGRRHDDELKNSLPRKSSRLAREAAEKAAQEIEVSEGMIDAGAAQWRGVCGDRTGAAAVYRAMERVRREELKAQGAPSGASVPVKPKAGVETAHAETVAVGFQTNRDDGLASLHVGSTVVLLDSAEREALATMLKYPTTPQRGAR
jgi:hypothetical protein